jgi:hypothetical protein
LIAVELDSLKQDMVKGMKLCEKHKFKIEHLIKMCYCSKQYEWQAVLDYHSSVVDETNTGRAKWGGGTISTVLFTLVI